MKSAAAVLVLAALLPACTTPSTPEAKPGDSAAAVDSSGIPPQWPVSAELTAKWGPMQGPSLQLNGKQGVYWKKPGGGLVAVVYHGTVQPRVIRNYDGTLASDGKLTVMGRTVDFYGSGNETAEISTQAVALTLPGGGTGWFTFEFSAPEHLKGKNIPAFSW